MADSATGLRPPVDHPHLPYDQPMDRQPEAWETNAVAPFLTVGAASVQTLGQDRYLVVSPGAEQVVEGFDAARERAHEVARRPG